MLALSTWARDGLGGMREHLLAQGKLGRYRQGTILQPALRDPLPFKAAFGVRAGRAWDPFSLLCETTVFGTQDIWGCVSTER